MKLFFVSLLLLSTSAWAQIDSHILGTWQGQLTYEDQDGAVTTCAASNTFSVEDDMFKMRQILTGNCDWSIVLTMQLRGQEIWYDGVKIGRFIGDNAFEFTRLPVEDRVTYSASMITDNAEGNRAVFLDRTDYGDGCWDSLSGEMVKAPAPLL